MRRFVIWRGTDAWRTEAAAIDLTDSGVRATGTQLGLDPVPYRLDYELDAAEDWVTRQFTLRAVGEGWERSLKLARAAEGEWSIEGAHAGTDVGLGTAPSGDEDAIATALDCDLAFSPLTNLMPVRRRLPPGGEPFDLVCAWVLVPQLTVIAYPQRYEPVGELEGGGRIVRFVDRGPGAGFVAELHLDSDGLVVEYPDLATRVGAAPSLRAAPPAGAAPNNGH
jgi:hypothetical protein